MLKKNEIKVKPVILTASNKKYYQSLEANIYSIHTHFKDYDLIVYDLGLTEQMRQKVSEEY